MSTKKEKIEARGSKLSRALREFVESESLAGGLLILSSLISVAFVNSGMAEGWLKWLHTTPAWATGAPKFLKNPELWVNDGLMAIFFLVVGLEIKREVVVGELRGWHRAAMPLFAAVGGMLVPISIAFAVGGQVVRSGAWAIPMATDIAFALGILTLMGSKAPRGLRLFLATLAIIDDLGAVIVIAVAFTSTIQWAWLGAAAGIWLLQWAINRWTKPAVVVNFIAFGLLWFAVGNSGVHATIAGVLSALAVSLQGIGRHNPLEELEHSLHKVVAYVILPVFAFVNAGVPLRAEDLAQVTQSPLAWAIFAGLILGKPIGVVGGVWIAKLLRAGQLPEDVRKVDVISAALLAGIGFTMSFFVASLVFPVGLQLQIAKTSVLVASTCCAVIAMAWISAKSLPPGSEQGEAATD